MLEDRVLEAIVAISEGKSAVNALDALYWQLSLLENDLKNDVNAMDWFNLSTVGFAIPPTPPASVFPSTPSRGASPEICLNIDCNLNIV